MVTRTWQKFIDDAVQGPDPQTKLLEAQARIMAQQMRHVRTIKAALLWAVIGAPLVSLLLWIIVVYGLG